MPIKVGIVGLGAIGNYIVDRISEDENFIISAVWDIVADRYHELADRIESPPPLLKFNEFPPETDVFVECASVNAVEEVVIEAFKRGKTVIVASKGGLLEKPSLWDLINRSSGKMILPSGAIGGLDILKALNKDDIESVELTTRKHPRSLPKDAVPSGVDVFTLYDGPARDAIIKYPQNVNVAALLSLAGIGFDRTKIKLIADSNLEYNTHEVEIKSKTGNYFIKCENFPFERNPATSKLAAQSIWASLKSLSENISYGL